MLLPSGFGPRDALENAHVTMNGEVPGVGQHLEDYLVRTFFIEGTRVGVEVFLNLSS